MVAWDQEPYEDDDIPPPPPPEFDPDAEYALASPGLYPEERAEILREARALQAGGLTREALCNWICRKVARTAGGRSGFVGIDAEGNEIDPPHVAAAREQFESEQGKKRSEQGRKRQIKRNADLKLWRQRCRELTEAGESERAVWKRCSVAIDMIYRKAKGLPVVSIPAEFNGLPVLYGRDGSRPRDKRRLRKRLFG
jgi:hypothetical protein